MTQDYFRDTIVLIMKRIHAYISGRVQGVSYRSSTKAKAEELGVAGWVKNLPGGRVEAVFEGESEDVEKIIEWCKKGPPAAQVANVEISKEEPERLDGFNVIR